MPDPEKPLSGFKFKCLYDKEQKGPVTQIESIMGQIVSAIGQKIYVWSFINNDLTGVAFIDTQIFIHSISVIKNFVLYADITKSISILNYDKQAKTLSLISRDFQPMEIYTCNFVVDGPNLGFIVSDANCNLIIYSYQVLGHLRSYSIFGLVFTTQINMFSTLCIQNWTCSNLDVVLSHLPTLQAMSPTLNSVIYSHKE